MTSITNNEKLADLLEDLISALPKKESILETKNLIKELRSIKPEVNITTVYNCESLKELQDLINSLEEDLDCAFEDVEDDVKYKVLKIKEKDYE